MKINNAQLANIAITTFIAAVLVGCTKPASETEMVEVIQVTRKNPYHVVSDGETVGSVAEMHGMSRAELIKLNDLQQPYQLYAGQRLIVRVSVSDELPQASTDSCKITLPSKKSNFVEGTAEQSQTNPWQERQEAYMTMPPNTQSPEREPEPEPQEPDYAWPVAGAKDKISKPFANDGGIVIEASAGTPVRAIAGGKVVVSGVPDGDAAAYGITIVIRHAKQKKMSMYSHLKAAKVSKNQNVNKGDIIGEVGQSGSIAKKPQLYFEIDDLTSSGRKAVDPEKLLP